MKAWFLRWFGSAPKVKAEPARAAAHKATHYALHKASQNASQDTSHDASNSAVAAAPQAAAPRPRTPSPASAADPLAAVRLLASPETATPSFFAWLLDAPGDGSVAAAERERQALQRLDKLIASAAAGTSLLPRSAAVVPKLLASLRGSNVSLPELSEQISRDMTLVAEVVRMANSPFYRPAEAVVEVAQAIRVLGVDGLRKAIARAVLKPLMDAPGSKEAALATQRLWEHTDKKAQLCSALARCLGLDAFEGYLLGLVHNAVWSVVLRAVDGLDSHGPWRIDAAFETRLNSRRDRLFGLIAQQWQLSETLTRVAGDIARRDPAAMSSPPVLLLQAGHRLASALSGQGDLPPAGLLDDAGKPLRDCCANLAHPVAAITPAKTPAGTPA